MSAPLYELRSMLGNAAVSLGTPAGHACPPARFDFAAFVELVHRTLCKGVHLVQADSASGLGLATGFIVALLGVLDRTLPILWIASRTAVADAGRLYGPGLLASGLEPGRVLFVEASRSVDVLWAIEAGLRSNAVAAAVGEFGMDGRNLDLCATRRLALRSESSGTPCYLSAIAPADGVGATAARTRWRVGASPSRTAAGLLGEPCWTLDLLKNRDGPCGRTVAGFSPARGEFFPASTRHRPRSNTATFPALPGEAAAIAPLVVPFGTAMRQVDEADRR